MFRILEWIIGNLLHLIVRIIPAVFFFIVLYWFVFELLSTFADMLP